MDADTAAELEGWLRKGATDRTRQAESRRDYARSSVGLSGVDRREAHRLAEQMMGRKLPTTTRDQDRASAKCEERIAVKLDLEAAMLTRFADFISSLSQNEPPHAGERGSI